MSTVRIDNDRNNDVVTNKRIKQKLTFSSIHLKKYIKIFTLLLFKRIRMMIYVDTETSVQQCLHLKCIYTLNIFKIY